MSAQPMNDLQNPYESPRYASPRPLSEPRVWHEGVDVCHVDRRPRVLRVVLRAPLEIYLEYRASMFMPDTVHVDGHPAAQQASLSVSLVNQVDFQLCCVDRTVAVLCEARWHILLPRIQAFRIQMNELTVYSDGYWKPPNQPR